MYVSKYVFTNSSQPVVNSRLLFSSLCTGYTCSIAGSLRMDALLGMVLKRHLAVDTVRLEILRLVDMLVQGKSAGLAILTLLCERVSLGS